MASFLWSCSTGVDENESKPPANSNPPTVAISTPQVNSSVVGTAVYSLKFSEAVTGLTGNNLNAACEGSIQLNRSIGGNCYPISISSTDNINWTVDPVGELSDGAYTLTVTTGIQNLSDIFLASPTSATFNVKDALSTVANQLETDLVKAGLSPSLAEAAKASARTTAGSETNDLLNVIPSAFDGAFDAIATAGLNEVLTQVALSTIIESLLSNVAGQSSLVSVHSSARVAALPSNFSTLLTSLITRVATKSANSSTTLQTLTTALVSSLPVAGATATEIETSYVSSIVQTATTIVMTTTTDKTTRDNVLAGLGEGVVAGAKQITTLTVNIATIQTAATTSMATAAASSDITYDVSTATTALVTPTSTETPNEDKSAATVVHPSRVVQTVFNLPTCNSSSEGYLYYVESASEFQYCSSNGPYKSIDLTGPQGSTALLGSNMGAFATISCIDKPFTFNSINLRLSFKITILSSLDLITSAILRGNDFGVSGSEYYSTYQVGGDMSRFEFAGTILPVDIVGANTFGYFKANLDGSGSSFRFKLTYYDSSLSYYGYNNPYVISGTTTECIKNIYTSRVGNRLFH
jgi:hypothetical protein